MTPRRFLRGLYAVVKDCDAHIRFSFITGVSKFSKVSLFSGLNNLKDITHAGGPVGAARRPLDSHTTPSPSPSRIERIRGMVARHRRDPVRASFRATDAAVPVVVPRGERLGNADRRRDRSRNPPQRANVINSVEAQPASTWSNASASPRSMVRPYRCRTAIIRAAEPAVVLRRDPLDRVAGRPSRGGSREPASVRFSRSVAKQRQVARSAAHRPLS